MDLSIFPPPPPWRKEVNADGSTRYINDINGEISETHPLQHVAKQVESPKPLLEAMQSGEYTITTEASKEIKGETFDFRCTWQEVGLMGNIYSYGVSLRYFASDQHVEIRFDGVEAAWVFNKLLGPYGPVDRNDLFVGAQIKIFGRHLSITSTTADICMDIDKRAEHFQKEKAWLQSKIESVGAVPAIRREAQTTTRNITRHSNQSGRYNLRKMYNDNVKLKGQMGELGIGHMLARKR